jgi:hypothetical protein
MTVDRWNPRKIITETEKPARVYLAGGPGLGDSSVVPRGKTWGIRERGDTGGTVVHAYRCPVHGVFEATVYRSYVPDVIPCPLWSVSLAGGDKEYASQEEAAEAALRAGIHPDDAHFETQVCADNCTWAGSSCGIGISSGEVTC